ncbi:MAG: sugar phosphate nucleotidyltransferase [Candidatus Korobacteraceae bacterium]|jgi:NDP-sugar pyrophosphorylase family protein
MRAMILAAGLGTRLRPLTNDRPKALVEINGHTLLEITLTRLRGFGIHQVIINVHHFADMIVDYLTENQNFGMRIEISREEVLLDTGGGLKKAAHFFLADKLDEPFLLHNVDVISSIDLRRMTQFHTENDSLATLAVQAREASRYLLFDDRLHLCGRRSSGDPEAELVRPAPRLQALAFCGIHVISRRIFPLLTEEGTFPIVPAYLRLAAQGEKILGFRADEYSWRDLGKLENVRPACEE